MRIAHTVEFYWPRVGGAERVVKRVSEHLALRGHDVSVLTSWQPGLPREEQVNNVRVRRFAIRGNHVKGIRGRTRDFIEAITADDYDIILNYACQSWPTDLTLAHLDRISAAKVVAPCGYSGLMAGGLKKVMYKPYLRRLRSLLPHYEKVVFHSPNYVDFELACKWGLTSAEIIPNGVDVSEFAGATVPRRALVATISNHYLAKGHADFLRLADSLKGEGLRFRQVSSSSMGNAWCRQRCRLEGTALGVEHAEGADRDVVRRTLAEARVVVIASKVECSPLVALEAMAAGTPFVSYEVGCVGDFSGGIVVGNFAELRAVVRRLAHDELLWHSLSRKGRAEAAKLDWSQIASRYEDLYSSVVHGVEAVTEPSS